MNKIGVIKTKILKKLTESFESGDKTEMKQILSKIVTNKDFKEMYLFYEEIENLELSYPDSSQIYVETIEPLLVEKAESIREICDEISKYIGEVDYEKNDLYESLDTLSEKPNLKNIDKKVIAKKKLIEHLKNKKQIKESIDTKNFYKNEALLYSVLSNNFNVLYDNTLSESEKKELKSILSIGHEELKNKVKDLKESVLSTVENLLSESKESELNNKLTMVKSEVGQMEISKYNYYRLKELSNSLSQ